MKEKLTEIGIDPNLSDEKQLLELLCYLHATVCSNKTSLWYLGRRMAIEYHNTKQVNWNPPPLVLNRKTPDDKKFENLFRIGGAAFVKCGFEKEYTSKAITQIVTANKWRYDPNAFEDFVRSTFKNTKKERDYFYELGMFTFPMPALKKLRKIIEALKNESVLGSD
jgi:hypothetical protein